MQKLAHDKDPKAANTKQTIRFNYTLNKLDIPTPYQGQPYDGTNNKIFLTKELLGPDVDKAELKVIGFIEGQMPSLVAT